MINSVVLMGRLTYEPELKTTTSGLSVIRFQMAVDRNYQSQGQERQADFIDVVAWRQTADFVSRYFCNRAYAESGNQSAGSLCTHKPFTVCGILRKIL